MSVTFADVEFQNTMFTVPIRGRMRVVPTYMTATVRHTAGNSEVLSSQMYTTRYVEGSKRVRPHESQELTVRA
jgi:hypothetical protein